ncbi:MAG: LLM class flavin-dependent oxidoreductase [Novosphingobium sp.]|jgi:probable F420-dependent oxidoreductase|nr:LLM class flavin-dependent oxidoreductase [Novosphingobium sp.]
MSGKLTFGYLYDFRNPPQWRRPWEELYAETLDVIAETERLGFQGAWLPEHHLAEDGYLPSPLVALAAVAARTSRMRIGTGVALAPLYNPVRFAQDAALVDILSNGRLDLGLAIGYRKRETAAFGVDFTRRGARFDEFLRIVTRLWAGETVDFSGRHFQIAGALLRPPAPRGRVPLYIGGFAEKAMERVARYGDGYIGSPDVCGLYVDKLREQGKDPAAARIRVTGLTTVVARDPEAAMAELAPHFLHVNNSYGEFFAEDQALGMAGMKPKTLEEYKACGELQILTPDAAIAMFRDMQARMPVEHFMMAMPPGLPAERFLRYAADFAEDVIPAFV